MEWKLMPYQMEMAESLARYANNPKVAQFLRDAFVHPYGVEDARRYIQLVLDSGEERQLVRAIVVDGEAAGSIGVFCGGDVGRLTGELGYWLAEPHWGKGIVTRAVGQICGEAMARFGLVRVFAEPFANNPGSARVLEKAGFVREGTMRKHVIKNGEILDSHLYAMVRESA